MFEDSHYSDNPSVNTELLLQASWVNRQAALQQRLEKEHGSLGLGEALASLHRQQLETGFIKDELRDVQYFRFPGSSYTADHFRVQFNPARARRFKGVGPAKPPPGSEPINQGCFLCAENIRWQSRGLELGYRLPKPLDRFKAWMNPFPLAPCHVILASMIHEPQHWQGDAEQLQQLTSDLIDVVAQIPGWVGFYNGLGAGASVPGHLHYQLMPQSVEQGAFPLEQSLSAFNDQRALDQNQAADQNKWNESIYPLRFLHWRGTPEGLKSEVGHYFSNWKNQTAENTSANIIVLNSVVDETLDLIFVPRDSTRPRAVGLDGVIGSLETLGEIICSSAEELERIKRGEFDYQAIADMLSQVSISSS